MQPKLSQKTYDVIHEAPPCIYGSDNMHSLVSRNRYLRSIWKGPFP